MLLVVEACVRREVIVVGVGNVASLFSARAFVWGDVDPHVGGLDAGEPDGGAVVVKIRAPVLLVCLGCVKKLAAWRWARIYSRRRKSPLILSEVVMTAGRKRKLRSL